MSERDTSYGVVPLRQDGEHWQMLLVKHRAGHWGFPKGHPDDGEEERHTAARELEEETACRVVEWLDTSPLQERYQFVHEGKEIDKTVVYHLAIVEGDIAIQDDELADARWCDYEDAIQLLTYEEARRVCSEVATILNQLSM